MKKSWLKYLWLLGFLGLLGPLTSNVGLYGFFGFFGYMGFTQLGDDERLQFNINKSARNAFVAGILLFCILSIAVVAVGNLSIFLYGFIVNFTLQIVVFILSLQIYERRAG